jgi:hypothetical protein
MDISYSQHTLQIFSECFTLTTTNILGVLYTHSHVGVVDIDRCKPKTQKTLNKHAVQKHCLLLLFLPLSALSPIHLFLDGWMDGWMMPTHIYWCCPLQRLCPIMHILGL